MIFAVPILKGQGRVWSHYGFKMYLEVGEKMGWLWSDERNMPMELIELFELEGIPEDLKLEIEKANNEIYDYGAVTYITKANIEHLIHKNYYYLKKLADKAEAQEEVKKPSNNEAQDQKDNSIQWLGGTYTGQLKDNKPNGLGTLIMPNGASYFGYWKDGKANGKGRIKYKNGALYVGELKDNKRNGQGTYIDTDGIEHVGEWKDGKLFRTIKPKSE